LTLTLRPLVSSVAAVHAPLCVLVALSVPPAAVALPPVRRRLPAAAATTAAALRAATSPVR